MIGAFVDLLVDRFVPSSAENLLLTNNALNDQDEFKERIDHVNPDVVADFKRRLHLKVKINPEFSRTQPFSN